MVYFQLRNSCHQDLSKNNTQIGSRPFIQLYEKKKTMIFFHQSASPFVSCFAYSVSLTGTLGCFLWQKLDTAVTTVCLGIQYNRGSDWFSPVYPPLNLSQRKKRMKMCDVNDAWFWYRSCLPFPNSHESSLKSSLKSFFHTDFLTPLFMQVSFMTVGMWGDVGAVQPLLKGYTFVNFIQNCSEALLSNVSKLRTNHCEQNRQNC